MLDCALHKLKSQCCAQSKAQAQMVNTCQQRISILEVTKQRITEAMDKTIHESKEQKRTIIMQCEVDIAKIIDGGADQDSQVKEQIMIIISATQEKLAAEQERCRIAMMSLRDELENVLDDLTPRVIWDQENYGHLYFLV